MIRHSWNISPARAIALQRQLAAKVVQTPLNHAVHTVAGADCAFVPAAGHGRRRAEHTRIVTVAVLCDAGTMEVLAARRVVRACRFPYVPGLLSFREAPAIIQAIRRLPTRPDLLMCDGQGIAHPRRLGLAAHVGLWLGVPTIGVGKSRRVGTHRRPGLARGCRAALADDGEVIGAVLRTRSSVKPVYVSVGHRITLKEAVRWTLRCGRGLRLPEPTRQGHLRVTALTAKIKSVGA